MQPKTIWTKFYRVPVIDRRRTAERAFTHIEDDLTVPMPNKDTLEAYVLYIGFDPMGRRRNRKRRPRRSASRRSNG